MSDEQDKIQSSEPPKQKSSMLALVIGFFPSVLILSVVTLAQTDFGRVLFSKFTPLELWPVFVISVFCCLFSSFSLFRRNTALAILFGIIFLLLNGAISFFFGCAAILSGMNF